MRRKIIYLCLFAAALFAAACGKSDADLAKAVNEKLAAEKVSGVTVSVKGGVATLSGEVADIAVKNKAEAAAKSVEGIKSVDNKLTTKPLPTPEPPSPDKMLEGQINEAIKKLGLSGITVTVANGEVTLSGEVAKADLAKVMQAANEAKPKRVINKLTVK
jgi:osmotically-inducible protein OsmY